MKLLLVTRQAGSAAAFQPLLHVITKEGWKYDIIAAEASIKAWGDENILIEGDVAVDYASYDLVLTGTSLNVVKDAHHWSEAQKNGVPSIAFVESWVNYAQRFTINQDFDAVPDYIFVVDELAAQRMREAGCPKQKIRIVGHPRFDYLLEQAQNRTEKNVVDTPQNIVFYTDPVVVNTDDVKGVAGYTPQEVVRQVLITLKDMLLNGEYRIVLKPHPREIKDSYVSIVEELELTDYITFSNDNPTDLMLESDVIFGLNTILLVDSSILGKPTFSFQPERKIQHNDITDRKGIVVIKSFRDLEQVQSRLNSFDVSNTLPTSKSVTLFFNTIVQITENK